jgi:hypothetical protein
MLGPFVINKQKPYQPKDGDNWLLFLPSDQFGIFNYKKATYLQHVIRIKAHSS